MSEAPCLGRNSRDNRVPVLPMQSEKVPFTSFNATTGEVLGWETPARAAISVESRALTLMSSVCQTTLLLLQLVVDQDLDLILVKLLANSLVQTNVTGWPIALGHCPLAIKFVRVKHSFGCRPAAKTLPKTLRFLNVQSTRVVMPVKLEKTLNRLTYCIWPLKLPNLMMEKCPVKNPTDARQVSFLRVY